MFLLPPVLTPVKKKRGRPSKQQAEEKQIKEEVDEAEAAKKAKRVLNRFNGMSVAEVMNKTLPDVLTYNLDILIVSFFAWVTAVEWLAVDQQLFPASMTSSCLSSDRNKPWTDIRLQRTPLPKPRKPFL